MPSIYPEHAPMPRAFLAWDGGAYRVCSVDANGHLQLDVLSSALPAGAATAANQALILGRQINHVTRYSARQSGRVVEAGVAAGGVNVNGGAPGAGVWWLITAIGAFNSVSGNTLVRLGPVIGGFPRYIWSGVNPVIDEVTGWSGQLLLTGTDVVRARFEGCTAGDTLTLITQGWVIDIT